MSGEYWRARGVDSPKRVWRPRYLPVAWGGATTAIPGVRAPAVGLRVAGVLDPGHLLTQVAIGSRRLCARRWPSAFRCRRTFQLPVGAVRDPGHDHKSPVTLVPTCWEKAMAHRFIGHLFAISHQATRHSLPIPSSAMSFLTPSSPLLPRPAHPCPSSARASAAVQRAPRLFLPSSHACPSPVLPPRVLAARVLPVRVDSRDLFRVRDHHLI